MMNEYVEAAKWLIAEYLKDVQVSEYSEAYDVNLIVLREGWSKEAAQYIAYIPIDPVDGSDTIDYAIYFVVVTDPTPRHEKGFVSVCRKKKTEYVDLSKGE